MVLTKWYVQNESDTYAQNKTNIIYVLGLNPISSILFHERKMLQFYLTGAYKQTNKHKIKLKSKESVFTYIK